MFTRNAARLAAGLCGLALVGLARPGQAQVVPGDVDKTMIRPGGHALGLGGAYLLLGDDPIAPITNPAALTSARASLTLAAEGRTSNVNIGDINKLVDSFKKLRDQLNASPSSLGVNTLMGAQGAFNDLYSFAASSNRLSGSASVGAYLGSSLSTPGVLNVGVAAYGGVTVDARLSATHAGGSRSLSGNGGAVGLTNIAVPIAFRVAGGSFGFSPKLIRADYAGFNASASLPDSPGIGNFGAIQGTAFGEVHDQKLDLDAGYISPAVTSYAFQGAVVVRHLLSPAFRLSKHVTSGPSVGPGDFNFSLRPELDLGGAASCSGARLVAEVHDLSGANGGGRTFHVGAEYPVLKYLVPRVGYDNNAFVYGVGVNVSNILRLNVAAGTDPRKRAAADLSLNFGF